jgi:hypothetical protein
MIYFTFNINNPFKYKEQQVFYRMIKRDNPFNNITIYKNVNSLLAIGFNIDLQHCYLEIGLLGYLLLLDKS